MLDCILYSNKKAGLINFHGESSCRFRPSHYFPSKPGLIAVVVPGANNLAEIIYMSLAKRFPFVWAMVLDGGILVFMADNANPHIINDNKLRLMVGYMAVTLFLA